MALTFNPHYNPYPGRRNPQFARRGMVCASQPQAAQAGLDMLKRGGNAVDAAVATAAALTVVEPTSNGLGSDAFALVWKDGRLHGLNASGPSPAGLSLDTAKGLIQADGRLPPFGWAPVTVPGAPAAWAALSERYGRLGLADSLAPAIGLAADGHPVALTVAYYWHKAYQKYRSLNDPLFAQWFRHFAPEGHSPEAGQLWRSPDQAATLQAIAGSKARDFYEGRLAAAMVAAAESQGGQLSAQDLAGFQVEWVEPISVGYRGYDVWEIPPNGQGLAALSALAILDGLPPGSRDNPDSLHLQIEAMKLGFADAHRWVADQRWLAGRGQSLPLDRLLSCEYAAERAALIGPEAGDFQSGLPLPGGTVYLCTADAEGTMVSYIQSNYMGFGSGIVIPNTGIAMNNRGHCFSLEEDHPNCLAPGKRPYNTIIPGFLTKDGQAVGPFGVMGGFMQPQGHLQVLCNSIDYGLNPQQALDAPRWQWLQDRSVVFEAGWNPEIIRALNSFGHQARYELESGAFGRGQIIWRGADGGLIGGTESRADGSIAAF